MIAFQIQLNRPNGIEYVVKQDQVNPNIFKVSDIFINAGLRLDNSGLKRLLFPTVININFTSSLKNIHTGVKFLFNSQTEF